MSVHLRAGSATDVGNVRSTNQDELLITDGAIFAVADGMGGHASGEVAAAEAVAALRRAYEETGSVDDVRHAVELANRSVYRKGHEEPEHAGMGTTLTLVAVVEGGRLAIANVGDSRTYLLRHGELIQLTLDHSFVQEAVRTGQLSPDEAEHHPRRNQLTRALGVQDDVEVDVDVLEPLSGDRLLLCSDGLWDELGDRAMASILRRLPDPDGAATELVRLAKEAGGRDNITVVVVDVLDGGEGARGAAASDELAADGEPATAEAERRGSLLAAGATSALAPGSVGSAHHDGATARTPAPAAEGHRLVTWRVLAFVGALLAVVGSAAFVLARGGEAYAVGLDADGTTIVVKKGDDVVERTRLTVDQVPERYRGQLQRGKREADLGSARAYVDGLARAGVAEGTIRPGGGAGVVVSTSSTSTPDGSVPVDPSPTTASTAAATPPSTPGSAPGAPASTAPIGP